MNLREHLIYKRGCEADIPFAAGVAMYDRLVKELDDLYKRLESLEEENTLLHCQLKMAINYNDPLFRELSEKVE